MSVSKESASSNSSTMTGSTAITTIAKTHRCAPIYLNILLLNKDELVGNKITEKTGKGFFGRAAAYTANKLITDEKIIGNLAQGLIDGVQKAITDLGIHAEISIKFKQGSLVVIRIQIAEIDTMQLILTAKGPEFASHFNTLLSSTTALGMGDMVNERVHENIYGSIGEGMIQKFNELIPQKMSEKGVNVDCQACSANDQAEVFFDLFEKLSQLH
mmetsp:Transcript_9679/g.10401  ORF Transcript_9679/g.10401 Transcript_9679/m.10401 type:complete len:215 (-) Transcript_9679:165-809(-)